MASSRAASRKQAKRFMAAARAKRLLNLKKSGEKWISDAVLRALASAGLPPDKNAYDARLKELERGV
jgi:hypothetical protein